MTHGLSWAPPGPALSSEDSGGGGDSWEEPEHS